MKLFILNPMLVMLCLIGFLHADSEIEVRDCRTSFVNRATLSSERAGVLAAVPREGDSIQQDEIVIRLRDDVPRANLKVAEARAANKTQIQVAEKSALAAAAEYDAAIEANQISSSSNPAFPPTHMTRLRLNAEAAKLEIDAARHEKELNELLAEQAQAELQSYWVIAKMNGLVTRVFKREGEGVQQGESIMQVVNTDSIRIEGYVSVEEAALVKLGMPVRVQFTIPNSNTKDKLITEEGKLGFVDVSVQTLSGVVRVWAEVENKNGQLREGLAAEMVILPFEANTNSEENQ